MNPSQPPRVVIKSNTARDSVVTIGLVILLLAALGFGVLQLREKPRGNALQGEVVGKIFTPLKEEIVEFNRNHLKSAQQSEGEFILKVRVASENGRIFEVPVSKAVFLSKKEGDSMTFIRPKSEQK